jgi:hypothetical protein
MLNVSPGQKAWEALKEESTGGASLSLLGTN